MPNLLEGNFLDSYALLLLSILLLGVGPALIHFTRRALPALAALDSFVFVTVGGLVLLYILPHALAKAGLSAAAVALAGFLGPFTMERFGGKFSRAGHHLLVAVVAFGFIPHALIDGVALSVDPAPESHGHGSLLPYAVAFHRLPVGFAIWWIVRPNQGTRRALLALVLISVATIIGFSLGGTYFSEFRESRGIAFGILEALVGGALLHVLLHRPHGLPSATTTSRWKLAETAGGLVGVAMYWFLPGEFSHEASMPEFSASYSASLLHIVLESAPALLLGYLTAGVLAVFLPQSSVAWLRRGRPWAQSLMGTAYGLPLPICSCGVVPIYRSLILKGVPASAAMAFLVATPELGVESLLLSWPLLGGKLTILRILCALTVALVIGRVVGGLVRSSEAARTNDPADTVKSTLPARIRKVFAVGFGEILDETAPWILLGIVVAAALAPLDVEAYLSWIPPGLDVLMFALVGIPVYICAAGATPLAAVLILKGLSPGAAVALLLTGPATNVTTYGVLSRLHGKKVALLFMLGVMVIAVLLGYAVNCVHSGAGEVPRIAEDAHERHPLSWACAGLLSAAFLLSIVRRGPRNFLRMLVASGNAGAEQYAPERS